VDTFLLIGITGIGLGALYFLVACGLSLIYGLMGVLNFAHGAFLSVGAFAGYWFAVKFFPVTSNLSFALSILIGGIAGGFFALLVEHLVIKRLYNRHIDQALVTVGVSLFTAAMLGGWFGHDPLLLPTPTWWYNAIQIGDAFIPVDRLLYIGVSLLMLILFIVILRFTRIGLVIRAGVENRTMVQALGINVKLAFSTVFFLGGLAAGVGGVLIAGYSGGTWLIYGFIVVVVGGMGSLGGSALAALLIGISRQYVNYYAPGLGDFVVVILLAFVLIFRPQGLLGKVAH
jgi:branched-chain amino acid transport system permease protein